MNRGILFLVSGKKNSGKDTFSDLLCDFGFTKFSFEDELKDMCCRFANTILGGSFKIYDFYDSKLKETPHKLPYISEPVSPSQLLERFGTDFIRKTLDPDYWINRVYSKLITKDNVVSYERVVVSDWGFLNEYTVSKKKFRDYYDIYKIRIKRESEDVDECGTTLDSIEDGYFSFVIDNNGDLAEYKKNCLTVAWFFE